MLDNLRLFTSRLVLREIEESDKAALHSYWSDPEVGRYLPRGALDKKGVKALIQRAVVGRRTQPRKYFRLAMTRKDERGIVGDCTFRMLDPGNVEDFSRIIGQAFIDTIWIENFGAVITLRRLRQHCLHWVSDVGSEQDLGVVQH